MKIFGVTKKKAITFDLKKYKIIIIRSLSKNSPLRQCRKTGKVITEKQKTKQRTNQKTFSKISAFAQLKSIAMNYKQASCSLE